jgi:hypothetical protein
MRTNGDALLHHKLNRFDFRAFQLDHLRAPLLN